MSSTLTAPEFSTLLFTAQARQAIERAGAYVAAPAAAIAPEHLLLALLDDNGGVAGDALQALEVDRDAIRVALGAPAAPRGAKAPGAPLSDETQSVLQAASRESHHLGHKQIDSIHLLLGLLYESQSRPAHLLTDAGASLFALRQQLLNGPRRWKGRGWRFYAAQARAAIKVSPVFAVPLGLWLACGVWLWLDPPAQFVRPITMLFVIAGWVVSLCLHEFGHALAAFLGGDTSVEGAGYLSLNPLRYANPLFSIVLPVVFLLAGGIGLPGGAVYINPRALRSTRWERIVSAAGPFATLLFAALIALPFWLPWETWFLSEANWAFWPALAMLGMLQVSALLFNLLPIPPLDGFGMIAPSLPAGLRDQLRRFGGLGLLLLFTLLWRDTPVADAFWQAVFRTTDALGFPLWLVLEGIMQFSGS